jgi:hypothetical protein
LKWEWYRITDDNPVQNTIQSACRAESGGPGKIKESTCCA